MLSKSLMDNILNIISDRNVFGEVFVEDRHNTNISMIGGKVEKAMTGRDYGIGIRIFDGMKTIYGYTNNDDERELVKLAQNLVMAIHQNGNIVGRDLTFAGTNNNHKIILLPRNIDNKKKVNLMVGANKVAKEYSTQISQVRIMYVDMQQNIQIANNEGLFTEDSRVRTRLMINSVATKDDQMQSGFMAPGSSSGFEFYDTIDVSQYAKEASRVAVTMANAEYCPQGKMPVVIDNGFGGVIFHEACGHGLEATSVAKGTSVFCDKLGEKVANEKITAIDDGTIPNGWGSLNIDDEGTKTQKNILIENGILKSYLIDKVNGIKMGMQSTGSGRRQSYKYSPTSRMTNTYIDAGSDKFEDMISTIDNGLYAKYMGGGSVNTATGDFNFAVSEGYLIKNGKIDKPVRGATLIGNGPEILNKIDMVGDNLTHGQGMCGSISGSIPTNVGQPPIRVTSITVGGRRGDE